MAEPSLQLGNGDWAGKSDNLLAYHKANNNFYADELTFARASTGTIVNSDGLIEEVPVNKLTYSEDFSNAAWTKIGTTVTSNNVISPDGALSASEIKGTGATIDNGLKKVLTTSTSADYTFSVFIKYNNWQYVYIADRGDAATHAATFDLVNNTVVGSSSLLDTKIESFTNGWFRYSIKFARTNTTTFQLYTSFSNSSHSIAPPTTTVSTSDSFYIYGAQLNSGSTAKTYYPTTTRLNIPRVDYLNNTNGSLLLEPQRTNLITYSEDFSQWTAENATATINNVISPDGTQNGTKLTPTASSQRQAIKLAQSQNGDIVISCFAKKGEYDILQITDAINGSYFVNFDLDNGVVGSSSVMIGEIENYGNGWYRCVSKYNSTSAINAVRFSIAQNATDGRLVNFAGNGTDSLYIYGAQVESGSYSTSYIPSSGTTVTRLVEYSSLSNDALVDPQNGDKTYIFNFSLPNIDGVSVYDLMSKFIDNSNRFRLSFRSSQPDFELFMKIGGVNLVYIVFSAALVANTDYELKIVINNGVSNQVYLNGVLQTLTSDTHTAGNITLNTPFYLLSYHTASSSSVNLNSFNII